jgi:probable phosphoglycerate mutase
VDLILIRHALPVRRETTDGPADPELSEAGRAQAELLAGYLATEAIDAIYSSPLRRALETAAPVAETHKLDIMIEEAVSEFDRQSSWYVPVEELKATNDPRWQQMVDGTFTDSLGVDPAAFKTSVINTIERVIADHPDVSVAVVCHGGVINAYLAHILGIDRPIGFFYPAYTSIHRVAASAAGNRSLVTLNETAHLRGSGLAARMHLG